MKYRPEIDGLRAFAVIAVILFHSNVAFMPGGFVGVDVFFVISGYLITSIIVTEMKEQRFSVANFYLRRSKRILPNLFAMVFATAALGALCLSPLGFERLMRSIATVSLSVSNFSFSKSAGYFDDAAGWKPMLHTWSLGVEEQFYLFLPLYLLFMRSRLGAWSWSRLIWLPLLVSFVISVVMVRMSPGAAYYLPFGRFWELLVGSALAVGAIPLIRREITRQIAGAAGMVLIALPVFLYSETTLFPGESALVPCIGAALIIQAARSGKTYAAAALSLPPLVFIGKLSYSLYLWHWPVLFFGRTFFGRELTVWEGLGLLPITAIVSYAAWAMIENPARHSTISFRSAAKLTAATVALCIGLSVVVEQLNGIPARFDAIARTIAAGADDTNPSRRACDGASHERLSSGDVCVLGGSKTPSVALLGDSIGNALAPGVVAAAQEAKQGVMILTKAGCRPVLLKGAESDKCQKFLIEALDLIKRTDSIKSVIVIGRWANIASGYRYGAPDIVPPSMPVDSADIEQLSNYLENEFNRLDGKRVFAVAFVPEQNVYVPQTLLIRQLLGMAPHPGIPRAVFDERQQIVRELFSRVDADNLTVLDASPYFCNNAFCPVFSNGTPAYVDDNHPSSTKAVAARRMFEPAFLAPQLAAKTAP